MHKLLTNYEFQTAVIGTFFQKTQRSLSIGHNWPLGMRKDPIDKIKGGREVRQTYKRNIGVLVPKSQYLKMRNLQDYNIFHQRIGRQ